MKSNAFIRLTGYAVMIISVIALLLAIRHSHPASTTPRPVSGCSIDQNAELSTKPASAAADNRIETPTGFGRLSNSATPTLTGEAAKAELRKNGPYESLGEALAAARHAVEKIDPADPNSRDAQFFAANPKQQLRAWFSNSGVELASGVPTPDGVEPWNVALRLRAVGRTGDLTHIAGGHAASVGSRVEVLHQEGGVTQWFENRKEGLEQGFVLTEQPRGAAGEVLVLLDVTGNLHAEALEGPDSVRFVDDTGAQVVHYTALKAWDAAGRVLPARMDVRAPGLLALVVSDAGASYPVTIDPMFANVEARLTQKSVTGSLFGSAVALAGDTALVGAANEGTIIGGSAGSAYAFVRSGTVWTLQAKLTGNRANEQFGTAVALSGDTALIGAPWEDAGSAYIFMRSGGAWSQQAKLIPADGVVDDFYGDSVAISGDTAVVGADNADAAGGIGAGSAYVYIRHGGLWSQQTKLTASDGESYDTFGTSVTLSGNTVLVGAPFANTSVSEMAGSVYAFVRSGVKWTQQAKLIASDGIESDWFGSSLALAGETAVIGAPQIGAQSDGDNKGKAYVFVRKKTQWKQQETLTAKDGTNGCGFGKSVAISGTTVLVGSPFADMPTGGDKGCIYVFTSNNSILNSMLGGTRSIWKQQARIVAGDGIEMDNFGHAVALSGNSALIGLSDSEHAYVFVRKGSVWSQQAILSNDDAGEYDTFGSSVAIAGDIAVVGAYHDDTMAGVDAGSAYVFARNGNLWYHEKKLTAKDGARYDFFGHSVAISGDTALVGSFYSDTGAGVDAGSVYVYVRDGGLWSQQAKLTAKDAVAGDMFGWAVALSGDTALIGVPWGDTAVGKDAGRAYVFVRNGVTWSQQAKLTADDAAVSDYFSMSVALSGDTALIGAPYDDIAAGNQAGCAYVFERSGTVWNQQARLTADDAWGGELFGSSVAISGDTALIGAPEADLAGEADGDFYDMYDVSAGIAYVFVRRGATWSQQAELIVDDSVPFAKFGTSVALAGDTALVGAPWNDVTGVVSAGNVYVYTRSGTVWNEQMTLTPGVDMSSNDEFGIAVALSGDTALIGASYDDTAGTNTGSAYAFLLGERPEITRQPVSRTVIPGQQVTFSMAATGYAPLRYQWRMDGYEIAGANDPSYTIPSAQVTDQGNYDCVVSNIGGVSTSSQALLTVNALSQFAQTFPLTPPDALGYVFVNLTPYGVGGWRFAGEQQWRLAGVPVGGLATADRVIEFRPVPGYLQPPAETVGVVSGGAATVVERVYYETPASGSGSITVTLKPEALADAGVPQAQRAQWRLLGEDDSHWRDSNATLGGLVPGDYLIECKPVAERSTPPPGDVWVQDGQTALTTLTYFLADAVAGTAPGVLPFETVATSPGMPYAYVGQIRSDVGVSTGFVVKARVVATAGHVVFDDARLAAVTGLEWLFQRDRGSNEPKPQVPRGFYLFDSYAAQRAAEHTPGTSTPQSQNLDAAAIYFLVDAGRGGFGGYLASDADDNEFLLSAANKMLAGYPVDGIAALYQGRMHATPAANVFFARAYGHTYTTSAIRSSGGASGGPLCVQFEGGS